MIGLQEVLPGFWENMTEHVDYKHHVFRMFRHRRDGLAVLSKYPFESVSFLYDNVEFQNSLALNVTFKEMGMIFSVMNVHLPWDSILAKEKQTVVINEYASWQKETVEYFILLGDFNCSYHSSVHNFLIGEQTLLNCEVSTIWYDLAQVHASKKNCSIAPTLDFNRNPRWGGRTKNKCPLRAIEFI